MRGLWRLRQIRASLREQWATARALRAVSRFPSGRLTQPNGLQAPLVITLTSYPPRFPTLALTLRSLLDQATKPDRVILWLTPEDRESLPAEVVALADQGLELGIAEDIRSYKKLIPALRTFPDSVIVTADDDVYSPPDWLTRLVSQAKATPDAIVGLRCHIARIGPEGALLPYGDWEYETAAREARSAAERLLPTGNAGILYPPRVLPNLTLDATAFLALCPTADDLWFFWMARLAGIRHVQGASYPLMATWPKSQDSALSWTNIAHTGNDEAIRALEERFGPVP